MFRFGVRRSNDEVKSCEPLIGWLEMAPAYRGSKVQKLDLLGRGTGTGDYAGIRLSILTPLFDANLSGVAKGSMTISGTQNHSKGAVMQTCKQVWWVRLLESQDPDTKTSDPHYHPECSKMFGDNPPSHPQVEIARSI